MFFSAEVGAALHLVKREKSQNIKMNSFLVCQQNQFSISIYIDEQVTRLINKSLFNHLNDDLNFILISILLLRKEGSLIFQSCCNVVSRHMREVSEGKSNRLDYEVSWLRK